VADAAGELLAVMTVEDIFPYDRDAEARAIFQTTEVAHPGVAYLESRGEWLIGGTLEVFRWPNRTDFHWYRLDPAGTRRIFREPGWQTIAGFWTRNPVHRAHEYIQETVLEIVDGLLLHPIAGQTKSDDISLTVRMRCYEVVLENYHPPGPGTAGAESGLDAVRRPAGSYPPRPGT